MNEPDHLDDSSGVRLSLDDYRVEFKDLQWTIAGQQSWKLEREQRFREPGFASWEAFSRGDWDEALRLIEEERDFLVEFSAKNANVSSSHASWSASVPRAARVGARGVPPLIRT